MAYEETFYIDYINKKAVRGLKDQTEITEWKQYYGSIVPIRVYFVKPIENANKQPYFTVEPIEPLNLRVSMGLIPNDAETSAVFQGTFELLFDAWADDTTTNSWTGDIDLDEADLRRMVAERNPTSLWMQFEAQVSGGPGGSRWVTAAIITAKIYNSIRISN